APEMVPEANPPSPFVTSHSRDSSNSREWLALSHSRDRVVKAIWCGGLGPVRNYFHKYRMSDCCRFAVRSALTGSGRLPSRRAVCAAIWATWKSPLPVKRLAYVAVTRSAISNLRRSGIKGLLLASFRLLARFCGGSRPQNESDFRWQNPFLLRCEIDRPRPVVAR